MSDDNAALEVLGACMAQSAADAAFTTNALLAYEKRSARELAEAVVDLRDAIECSYVSTPALDRVYQLTYGAYLRAQRVLREDGDDG